MPGIEIMGCDAVDIYARTIWGEARGEGHKGMVAVACVIFNRLKADLHNDGKPDWWGEGVIEICKKPWQFSCWNKNDPNLPKLLAVTDTDLQFGQALAIAKMAKAGNLVDITNGATSYYDRRMPTPPKWTAGRVPVAEIGHHVFYKDT